MKRLLVLAALLTWGSPAKLVSQAATKPAVPADAITAILQAFKTHQIVGFGEHHPNSEQLVGFRLALIRDARLAVTVNDIVVEAGNAQHQQLIDGFMRGEAMSDFSLQQLSHGAAFWETSYEEFFRSVRAVNASLPEERRLRVLLGESPDRRDRVAYVVDLIRREVIAKNRTALVIYGNTFFMRKDPVAVNDSQSTWESITRELERAGQTKVFAIWTNACTDLSRIQSDVGAWPKPSIATFADTRLGAAEFARYSNFGGWQLEDGKPVLVNGRPVAIPPRAGLRMAEQYDALLYLARSSEIRFAENPRRCSG